MSVPGGPTPFQAAHTQGNAATPAPSTGGPPASSTGGVAAPGTSSGSGGTGGSSPPKQLWSRPDRINGIGVIIAFMGLVVGVGVPHVVQFYQYLHRARASIAYPRNGQHFAVNKLSISGSASRIPLDDVLWLTVSGPSEEIYPITSLNLPLSGGKWAVSESQIGCLLGPHRQQIVVWLGPDTSEAPFVEFVQNRAHPQGLLSVPLGFEKLSQVNISVSKTPGC